MPLWWTFPQPLTTEDTENAQRHGEVTQIRNHEVIHCLDLAASRAYDTHNSPVQLNRIRAFGGVKSWLTKRRTDARMVHVTARQSKTVSIAVSTAKKPRNLM